MIKGDKIQVQSKPELDKASLWKFKLEILLARESVCPCLIPHVCKTPKFLTRGVPLYIS